MQKMSNGDYFDEKMRRGDRSKEARRISPPLKLLQKSPKLRGSTAPKSAHLHRSQEQGEGVILQNLCNFQGYIQDRPIFKEKEMPIVKSLLSFAWNLLLVYFSQIC